jgi:hypothetical protein
MQETVSFNREGQETDSWENSQILQLFPCPHRQITAIFVAKDKGAQGRNTFFLPPHSQKKETNIKGCFARRGGTILISFLHIGERRSRLLKNREGFLKIGIRLS